MHNKKQRIISIVIGLILAILLLYIAVRIVQQRSSRASQPLSFIASRGPEPTTCQVKVNTPTSEPILLQYNTFYYRFEPSEIEELPDGTFVQQAAIQNLSTDQIVFTIEGNEESQAVCDPATSGADTDAGTDALLDGGPVSPAPTEPVAEETPMPTDEPLPTEEATVVRSALTLEMAREFFADEANEDADFIDCIKEFEEDYRSPVQVCNEAWQEVQ